MGAGFFCFHTFTATSCVFVPLNLSLLCSDGSRWDTEWTTASSRVPAVLYLSGNSRFTAGLWLFRLTEGRDGEFGDQGIFGHRRSFNAGVFFQQSRMWEVTFAAVHEGATPFSALKLGILASPPSCHPRLFFATPSQTFKHCSKKRNQSKDWKQSF